MLRRFSSAVAPLLALGLAACEPTNQGYAPAQPIKYSHAVHAGAMQIDCQYCHYIAERGRYAGIQPAQICMNCHTLVQKEHGSIKELAAAIETGEPIQWVRVHFLPDHVYFDHSVHIAAAVACQTCHGPVESMGRVEQWAPLTMGWCFACHRETSAAAANVDEIRASPLTDCAICHH